MSLNVIVIGAGAIGRGIAELLVREGHNLTIVDENPERIEEIRDRYDFQTFLGSASSFHVLKESGVENADIVLSMTNNDELNLLCSQFAKYIGAKKTVARVQKKEYLESLKYGAKTLRSLLGIDLVICPEALTAMEIVRHIADPNSMSLAYFLEKSIQIRQSLITAQSPIANKYLKDISLPYGLLLALISRDEEIIIPRGDTLIKPDDRATFIGLSHLFDNLPALTGGKDKAEEKIKSVCIAGGGLTGLYLAETLEKHDYSVTLVDSNLERCKEISESLTKTHVIQGDVTNRYFMEEERLNLCNVFIAITGDEETNIMSSLLAKELGVKNCITRVKRPDYAEVIEKVGIDLALSPNLITSEKILAILKRGSVKSVSLIEQGKVEALEFEVPDNTPIINKPLAELAFPRQSLIGIINSEGESRVPRGQDQIHAGDTVIIIAEAEAVDKIEKFFHPKAKENGRETK